MMYFPAPNLEPSQEINIDFTTISKASTGSTPANELYIPIVKGAVGDRIFIFMYAKYAASTVLIEAGWTSNAGSGYNPTYGQMQAYSKISNGTETRVRFYTEGGGVADISGFSFRVKGFLNPLVNTAYYGIGEVSSADTVVATGNMAQRPFISNYIYFTAMGKVGGTALTSSDIPTAPSNQVFLDSNTTSSTSFVVSYFKSKDASLSLNTTWPNTENARRSIGFYIQSDQRAMGDIQGTNGNGVAYASTSTHFLSIYPHFTKKASGYEEIYEFVFRTAGYTGTPDGVFQIGLYDITNGYAGAPLCVSASTSTILPNRINRIPITPYKLIQDKVYAIGFRSSITNTAPSASINIFSAYAGNFALRRSTLTGSSALSSTWSDAGTTSDSRFTVGASVRYTPVKEYNKIISNPAFIKNLNRAPDYPLLNTSNKITRGLSILYVPSAGPVNVITKQRSVGGTNRRRGAANGFALNDSRIDLPYPNGAPSLSKEITILAIATSDNSFDTMMAIYDSSNVGNETVSLCRSNLTGSWQNQWNSGAKGVRSSFSGDGFWEAGKVVVGVTARKNSGLNQFHRYYKNGKFFSDGSLAPAHDNNASNSVRIGEQVGGGNRTPYIYMLAVWGRALTDVELASISKDPYQILVPHIDKYYIEVPDGIFEITSVDGDDTVYDNQVVNIVGTGFGTIQGLVFIDGVQQSINSWSDTLINITVEQGALSLGANTLKVFKPI